jgi:hypothetical protein
MSKSSSFLKGVMPLVYAIVSVPAFFVLYLWFLVDGFGLLGEPICRTEVQGRLASLSGFDFEISETSCFFDPAVSVFVAKAGHSTKTRLFQYVRGANPVPVITLVGKNTVQISLSSMEVEHCRRDRWGPLRIKYDIGFVEYPGYFQPAEC